MKAPIEINSTEYAIFKKYSEFEIPKIFLLIPFFNIMIFHYISSSWFFNLSNPRLYKRVRYRFYFPFFINGVSTMLIFFFYPITCLITFNGSVTFYFLIILIFILVHLFFLNYFVIKQCKWSIWKFCLMNVSDDVRNSPVEKLPLDFYWKNFLFNLTKRTFEEKNRYSWFFRTASEENWKPIPDKIYCEAYNVYEIKDRSFILYDITGKRNYLFKISINLYYSLFVCAAKLCDQEIEIPKYKFNYFFTYTLSLVNYLLINCVVILGMMIFISSIDFLVVIYSFLSYLAFAIIFLFIFRKIIANIMFKKTHQFFDKLFSDLNN